MFRLFKKKKKEEEKQDERPSKESLINYFYENVLFNRNDEKIIHESIVENDDCLFISFIMENYFCYTYLYKNSIEENTNLNERVFETFLNDSPSNFVFKHYNVLDDKMRELIIGNSENVLISDYKFYPTYDILDYVKSGKNFDIFGSYCYAIEFEEGFTLNIDSESDGYVTINNVNHYRIQCANGKENFIHMLHNLEDKSLDCSKILNAIVNRFEQMDKDFKNYDNHKKEKSLSIHEKLIKKL